MSRKLWSWIVGLETLAFGLLEGSMVTLGLLVAPLLFKTIESRDTAGRLFGNILKNWLWLGVACSLTLVITALISLRARTESKPQRWFLIGRLLAAAIVLVLIGVFGGILFRMENIQNSLTGPIDSYPLDQNPRLEYDQLHKLSSNLLSAALFIALGWFGMTVMSVFRLRPVAPVSDGNPASFVTAQKDADKVGV